MNEAIKKQTWRSERRDHLISQGEARRGERGGDSNGCEQGTGSAGGCVIGSVVSEPQSAYSVSPHQTRMVSIGSEIVESFRYGRTSLWQGDCLDWLSQQESNAIHAVVTDPPYGLVEYTGSEQMKLRNGKGGVWRIPPSYDGHTRSPLPRFTTLTEADLENLYRFFKTWGSALLPVLVPGAQVVVASNPLVSHIVGIALTDAGLERRGEIVRLVMTLRGGDRPKNAHEEYSMVTVMPRSMWEPWLVFRKRPEGRVADNLKRWKTGGFRRISESQPFGDVIRSRPTSKAERSIAPHPSLKPQAFLRQIVRAVLPLGEGIVFDPFAGSGSTLAAAEAVGYESVGVEMDPAYVELARTSIPALAALRLREEDEGS